MGRIEEERDRGSRNGPIIASIASDVVSLAKPAATKGSEGVGRKKSSTPPYSPTWMEFRVGGERVGTTGRVPELGERQAVHIIGTRGVEDLQFNGGKDPGGSKATRSVA